MLVWRFKVCDVCGKILLAVSLCLERMGGAQTVLQSQIKEELKKPLDASDVLTPRGESMKAEIIHLRQLLHQISEGVHQNEQKQEDIIEINNFQSQESPNPSGNGINSDFDDVLQETPHHKDPHRILGVNDEEMKRNTAMKKLGITDDAYYEAEELIAHSGVARGGSLTPQNKHHSKTENILGYSEQQQNRSKAVNRVLGTSESKIEEELAERLGHQHQ